MKADSQRELITFSQAAQMLPEGARPSLSTWYRWWRRGVRGVRLQAFIVGGRRYTSHEAVKDFIRLQNASFDTQAEESHSRVERLLASEGI